MKEKIVFLMWKEGLMIEFSHEHWLPHMKTQDKVNHVSVLIAHEQIFLSVTYEFSHPMKSQALLNRTSQDQDRSCVHVCYLIWLHPLNAYGNCGPLSRLSYIQNLWVQSRRHLCVPTALPTWHLRDEVLGLQTSD